MHKVPVVLFIFVAVLLCYPIGADNYYPYVPDNPQQAFYRPEGTVPTVEMRRVPGCQIAWVNWDLLYRDYPQLRRLDQERVKQWLAETFGVISPDQSRLMGYRVRRVETVAGPEGQAHQYFRPSGYNRAHVQFSEIEVEGQTVRIAADPKGSGIGPGVSPRTPEQVADFNSFIRDYRRRIRDVLEAKDQLEELRRQANPDRTMIEALETSIAGTERTLRLLEARFMNVSYQEGWGRAIDAAREEARALPEAQRNQEVSLLDRELSILRKAGHSTGVATLGEAIHDALMSEAVGLIFARHNAAVRENGRHLGVVGAYAVLAYPREYAVYTGNGAETDPLGLVIRQAHLGRREMGDNVINLEQLPVRDWYGYDQTPRVGRENYRIDFGGQNLTDLAFQHNEITEVGRVWRIGFGMVDGTNIPAPGDPDLQNPPNREHYKKKYDVRSTKPWSFSHQAADAFYQAPNSVEDHMRRMLSRLRTDIGPMMPGTGPHEPKEFWRQALWRDVKRNDVPSAEVGNEFRRLTERTDPFAEASARAEVSAYLQALANRIICEHIPTVFQRMHEQGIVNTPFMNMYREFFYDWLAVYEPVKLLGAPIYDAATSDVMRTRAMELMEIAVHNIRSREATPAIEGQLERVLLGRHRIDAERAALMFGLFRTRNPLVTEALADVVLHSQSADRRAVAASRLVDNLLNVERPEVSSNVVAALQRMANVNLETASTAEIEDAPLARRILQTIQTQGRIVPPSCRWITSVTLPRILGGR